MIPELVILPIVLVINYCIGQLIVLSGIFSNLTKKESYFFSQLFGLLFSVSIYAIFRTHFNTIYMLTIPLLFLFFYRSGYKSFNSQLFFKGIVELIPSFFIATLLFLTASFFYYRYTDGAVFGDNQFYASIAYLLKTTGIESSNLDWTIAQRPATPYHYTEAWFTALWSDIFQLNTLRTYYLIYTPVFGSVVFAGAVALTERLLNTSAKYKYIFYLFAILFLFIQSIDIPITGITHKLYPIGSWFHSIKISIVYLIFIAGTLLALQRNLKSVVLILLLTIPFYSPLSVGILAGLFFYLGYLKLKGILSGKLFFRYLLLLILTVTAFIAFYAVQAGTDQKLLLPDIRLTTALLKSLKVFIKLFIFGILPALVVFVGIYFIRFRSKPLQTNFKIYLTAILIAIVGTLIVLMCFIPFYFYLNHDAFQLLGNLIVPLYGLLTFTGILIGLKGLQTRSIIAAVAVLFVYFGSLLYTSPSEAMNMIKLSYIEPIQDLSYFNEVESEFRQDPSQHFAYIRNYNGRHPMELKPFLFVPDNRIIHFNNAYIPLCLSALDLPADADVRYCNKNDYAFYRYCNLNKEQDLDRAYLQFVRLYKLKFIIVENGATLPAVFNQFIKRTITNRVNGNNCFVLKNI